MSGNTPFFRRTAVLLIWLTVSVFLMYSVYENLISNPEAKEFLSRKTGLKRELRLPVWLTVMHVHVIAAAAAMAAGTAALTLLRADRFRKLHRWNGYLYVLSTVIVNLSSGYMAPYATGGKINSIAFNAINIIWFVFTLLAVLAIRRGNVREHGDWMLRSYMFCYTNFIIHAVHRIAHQGFGLDYYVSYTAGIYGSIAVNLLAAQWLIRLRRKSL
ncbi:DUF2306 domain-containing protein [Paenibacillus gansuensis]|uniref:DUF2306 domain-containing protein n=1 Tax=Paenibacillus gansuensis TaxID=306542 RepID=A0ABW5PES8_9BACL